MIYEEPSALFDEKPWLEFRDFMLREVALHPDWPEAQHGLKAADEHLAWIKDWQKEQQQSVAETA